MRAFVIFTVGSSCKETSRLKACPLILFQENIFVSALSIFSLLEVELRANAE